MSEHDKALVRRLIEEAWSHGNFAVVDDLVDRDYVGHSSMEETQTHGVEGYKQFFANLRAAFPDITFVVDDQIAEDRKVATRWHAHGTHQGVYVGIPPTGKHGVVSGITIFRIADGKVVECWTQMDSLGLLQQLGLVPAPTPAG